MMFHLRGISMADSVIRRIRVLRRATVKYTRATTQRGTSAACNGLGSEDGS